MPCPAAEGGGRPAAGTSAAPCVLVIADPSDHGALRVLQALRRRDDLSVEVISTEQLLLAPGWVHDPLGETEITLGNGRILTNNDIDAVLCRIRHVDPPQFARARPRDRIYAQSEFYSLILSWLEQLGGKVHNRPHAGNLCGMRSSPLEDRLRFATPVCTGKPFAVSTSSRYLDRKEGAVFPYASPVGEAVLTGRPPARHLTPLLAGQPAIWLADPAARRQRHVTVVGDQVFGDPVSLGVRAAAVNCARERNITIAGMTLTDGAADQVEFLAVDPFPRLGDPATVLAVAELLARTALGRER